MKRQGATAASIQQEVPRRSFVIVCICSSGVLIFIRDQIDLLCQIKAEFSANGGVLDAPLRNRRLGAAAEIRRRTLLNAHAPGVEASSPCFDLVPD